MAETLKLPKKVVDSDWEDDIDIDYAIYGDSEKDEAKYISPAEVSKESIDKIKAQKIGHIALFSLKDKLSA